MRCSRWIAEIASGDLFRVFLLLPTVFGVGWYFSRKGVAHGDAGVPISVFGIVFLILCAVNSAVPFVPSLIPVYAPIKTLCVEFSNWGLLLAIGALGLGTSVKTIMGLGWRHLATAVGATLVILMIMTDGLMLVAP